MVISQGCHGNWTYVVLSELPSHGEKASAQFNMVTTWSNKIRFVIAYGNVVLRSAIPHVAIGSSSWLCLYSWLWHDVDNWSSKYSPFILYFQFILCVKFILSLFSKFLSLFSKFIEILEQFSKFLNIYTFRYFWCF